MIYNNLKQCVNDLEKNGFLVRINDEIDPDLEMAEIHRRVYANQGPALLFENVKGSPFPAVSNLFGTIDRSKYIFRSSLHRIQTLMELKADPILFFKKPWHFSSIPTTAIKAIPRKVRSGPVLKNRTKIENLPQIKSWPGDGGSFILLPQVYSEDPCNPGIMHSNLGMYRIQLSGNEYELNKEIGLHYQIRRDIGIHHTNALKKGKPLRVSIFIGGPPAHTFAAVMPLPEGLPEVAYAGLQAGKRFRYIRRGDHVISADADFCITGTIVPGETKPEGPFGDHLGYYSNIHEFPYLKVEDVYYRDNAIWPFTIVGRPPQEDTSFGKLIHEITGPVVPESLPGVKSLNAVDAAGVHPLLLAVARERYIPYKKREPMEILTIANSILGFGHTSLAKYLFIAAWDDDPNLDVNDIKSFFIHVLERVDWKRDIHFQTRTTIDTLDYTGTGLNHGSKVIIACAGEKKRDLIFELKSNFKLPNGFKNPSFIMPGILAIESPDFSDTISSENEVKRLTANLEKNNDLSGIGIIILTEDSNFISKNINNFLWITFTRSNPSHDIYGIGSFIEHKHWGCHGPIIIDARLKSHHAKPLIEDLKVSKKIDKLGEKGSCLHGII